MSQPNSVAPLRVKSILHEEFLLEFTQSLPMPVKIALKYIYTVAVAPDAMLMLLTLCLLAL
jgi:hypothetical protein